MSRDRAIYSFSSTVKNGIVHAIMVGGHFGNDYDEPFAERHFKLHVHMRDDLYTLGEEVSHDVILDAKEITVDCDNTLLDFLKLSQRLNKRCLKLAVVLDTSEGTRQIHQIAPILMDENIYRIFFNYDDALATLVAAPGL